MPSNIKAELRELEFPQNLEMLNLKNGRTLRILTFNVWLSGGKVENGIYKIAKHIKLLQPDIVALQEVQNSENFTEILEELGPEWSGAIPPFEYPDNAILTPHIIDNMETTITPNNIAFGVNIKLRDSNKIISFWALHLAYLSYGPYAANNKQVTQLQQILQGEAPEAKNGRQDNIHELLKVPEFSQAIARSEVAPVIVCGDLNSPSHLDWIEENKDIHGGWVVPWPATQILQSKTGLIDSFREIYPSPIVNPGITWSTVNRASGAQWDYKISEPLDRIDYIFYKSEHLKPVNTFTYAGAEPLQQIPNQTTNDYPSDHFALITDFSLDVS
uniref:Endonuclease/exonuclease/phosphatase domain-containing protein n=1 Tax=Panagrolaimus sp. ES5 TaxID=591445 RepID=A0AC34F3E6_9BILA